MKRNVFSVSSKRRRTLGCWGAGQSQLDRYWQETLFWKLTLKLCTSCLCFLPLYRNRANVFQHSFHLASGHRLSITIPQLFSRHPSNWWKHLKKLFNCVWTLLPCSTSGNEMHDIVNWLRLYSATLPCGHQNPSVASTLMLDCHPDLNWITDILLLWALLAFLHFNSF